MFEKCAFLKLKAQGLLTKVKTEKNKFALS